MVTTKDKLPILYAKDIVCLPGDGHHVVTLGDSWVIAFTGVRGSGKSIALAYTIARALIAGLTVWSNMNVKFKLVEGPKRTRICETTPLDWDAVYALEGTIHHGAIAIDELQYFVDSRASLTMGNRLINAVVNQIRKRSLDFYYTVKDIGWLDKRLVWETDIEIKCWDTHMSNPSIPKGHHFKWRAFDHSGTWTGVPCQYRNYEPSGEYKCQGWDRLWPIYSTEKIIDYIEAQQRVKLNAGTRVVGHGDDQHFLEVQTLQGLVHNMRLSGRTEVPTDQFQVMAREAGITMNAGRMGKELVNLGVYKKSSRNSGTHNVYVFSSYEDKAPMTGA